MGCNFVKELTIYCIHTFVFIFVQREKLKYSWFLAVTSEYHGDLYFVVGAHEEHHVCVPHDPGDPDIRVLGS